MKTAKSSESNSAKDTTSNTSAEILGQAFDRYRKIRARVEPLVLNPKVLPAYREQCNELEKRFLASPTDELKRVVLTQLMDATERVIQPYMKHLEDLNGV